MGCAGIEGTSSYGAGLARHLKAAGISVMEVERPKRRHLRRNGKSDPIDAEAAARAVLAGEAVGEPKSGRRPGGDDPGLAIGPPLGGEGQKPGRQPASGPTGHGAGGPEAPPTRAPYQGARRYLRPFSPRR